MQNLISDIHFSANVKSKKGAVMKTKHQHIFNLQCHDKNGNLKWEEEILNLVPSVGLDEILDKFYKGVNYTAAFYVGITGTTPSFAAGDTMSSHAGWTEVVAFDNLAVRPSLILGDVANQAVDNSANLAVFVISDDSTVIGGAFICTSDVKGGTAGVLIGGGAFSGGDKSMDDNDILSITVTATNASA